MNSKEWQAAFEVIATLQQAGFEAYVVGGAVRDTLLGKAVNDVDVATSALPLEVKPLFATTVDVGIEHGTVLIVHPLAPVEVTTFRVDGEYTDHRRPEQVQFVRELREDLARRDFTINAMALKPDGTVIDYFNGQQDLQQQVIRAVGNAKERFAEDALRMLRAVRFTAQLGFTVAPDTKQAMVQHAQDLQFVAIERVKQELDKMLVGKHVTAAIALMQETSIADVLPGVWHAQKWFGFIPRTVVEGWAYMLHFNRTQLELMQQYRLTNKEKRAVKQLLLAFDALVERGFTRTDYYTFDEDTLVGAVHMARHFAAVSTTEQEVLAYKQALPIQSRQELAVNGNDLQEWRNEKPGKWLQQALATIERAVVYGEVENTKQHIRSWYCNDNDER